MMNATDLSELDWLTIDQVAKGYGVASSTVGKWGYIKKVISKGVGQERLFSRRSNNGQAW